MSDPNEGREAAPVPAEVKRLNDHAIEFSEAGDGWVFVDPESGDERVLGSMADAIAWLDAPVPGGGIERNAWHCRHGYFIEQGPEAHGPAECGLAGCDGVPMRGPLTVRVVESPVPGDDEGREIPRTCPHCGLPSVVDVIDCERHPVLTPPASPLPVGGEGRRIDLNALAREAEDGGHALMIEHHRRDEADGGEFWTWAFDNDEPSEALSVVRPAPPLPVGEGAVERVALAIKAAVSESEETSFDETDPLHYWRKLARAALAAAGSGEGAVLAELRAHIARRREHAESMKNAAREERRQDGAELWEGVEVAHGDILALVDRLGAAYEAER